MKPPFSALGQYLGRSTLKVLIFASFFSGALGACNAERSGPPQSAAQKEVPQIYYLKEGHSDWWAFPGKGLQDSLGLRVVDESVNSVESAQEILRKWNARPADLLVLGPGLPQRAFQKLKLPKVPQRKLLLLSASTPPASPKVFSIDVDRKAVSKFYRSYCSALCHNSCDAVGENLPSGLLREKGAPCRVGMGLGFADARGASVQMALRIDWEAVIQSLLNDSLKLQRGSQQGLIVANFSSALLSAQANETSDPLRQKRAAEFLKSFALENLSP